MTYKDTYTRFSFENLDESANSFPNTSLFVIHFFSSFFQVTQEITNSLYPISLSIFTLIQTS